MTPALLFCSRLNFKWLQSNLLPCPFKKFTGIDCPLCGLQRSILALLQGHISESFSYYPATIPLIIALLISISGNRYLPGKLSLIKKIAFVFCGFLIAGSYIWKMAGM